MSSSNNPIVSQEEDERLAKELSLKEAAAHDLSHRPKRRRFHESYNFNMKCPTPGCNSLGEGTATVECVCVFYLPDFFLFLCVSLFPFLFISGHLTGRHERHFSISGCPLYHNLSVDECKVHNSTYDLYQQWISFLNLCLKLKQIDFVWVSGAWNWWPNLKLWSLQEQRGGYCVFAMCYVMWWGVWWFLQGKNTTRDKPTEERTLSHRQDENRHSTRSQVQWVSQETCSCYLLVYMKKYNAMSNKT